MVIGNYVYTPMEKSNGCTCYFVRPNFIPRQMEHQRESFGEQVPEGSAGSGAERLTAEKKSELREKLKGGQGSMSLQEWDDFLAGLEELGVITHDERFFANGTLHDIPESARSGGTHFASGSAGHNTLQLWKGNPLQWLNDMDVYALKNQLYANMGSRYTMGLSGQRDAYQKVSQILKDILY